MGTQKRLLVVTQHFWPEEFRINDIVKGFVADNISIDVLCGLPNYPKGIWFQGYSMQGPFQEEWSGIHVFRCKEIPRIGNSSIRIFLNYVSWPLWAACSLNRLPGNYDAVLCYNTSPVLMGWPAILAAQKFKAPLTTYVLDIWPENLYSVLPVKNRILRWVARSVSDWHYQKADRLIAMNPGLEERLRQRVGDRNTGLCKKEKKRYTVVPQFCEDFYANGDCDLELKKQYDNRFNIVFAGNFSPAQSLETALEAMVQVRNGWTEGSPLKKPHLLLVGDGMSRDSLEKKVREQDLGNWVRFYGRVSPEKVVGVLGASDALLVSLADSPDLGLTTPAKLASCMAAAKPILVSLNGEGAKTAQNSGGALVSAACDVQGLADNILMLANMKDDELAHMGKNAFRYYESYFRRDVLMNKIKDFIFGDE